MNHKSILCGFWPQSEVFPPEQERPASVRIGLGFSFSWNTFCSVLHGPTRDHSADIFRGHVPKASVAKREGQWRVWCYINTWRKWGKRKKKILGGLDEFWNAFPKGILQVQRHPTELGLKMAALVFTPYTIYYIYAHPHLHTSLPNTPPQAHCARWNKQASSLHPPQEF